MCEEDKWDTGGISIGNIGGLFIVVFSGAKYGFNPNYLKHLIAGIGLAGITLGIEYCYYKPLQSRLDSADTNKNMVSWYFSVFNHSAKKDYSGI